MARTLLRSLVALVVVLSVVACGSEGPGTGDGGAPPAPPANVSATPGPGYVDVAWEHDGANVTGFMVERRVVVAAGALAVASGDGDDRVEVGSVGAAERSFRDASVDSGVAYRYAVTAVGSGGVASSPQESAEEGVTPEPPGGEEEEEENGDDDAGTLRSLRLSVRDGDAPVVSASISAFVVDASDDAAFPFPVYVTTDEDGSAVLADFDTDTWISAGTYDVVINVEHPGLDVFAFVLFDGIAVPGVIDLDLDDARLVRVDVTVDPVVAETADVKFGRSSGSRTLYSRHVDVGPGGARVILERAAYETHLWLHSFGGRPAMVIDQVDLTASTSLQLGVNEAELVSVTFDAMMPQGVTVSSGFVCLYDARAGFYHLSSYCPGLDGLRTSPFVTDVEASVRFDDGDEERVVCFDVGQRQIAPAGGEVVLAFGGTITAETDTLEPTYTAGDRVRVTGSVSDASGNPLYAVYTVSRSPSRIVTVRPMLVVTDAFGEIVHEADVFRTLSATWGPKFTLADDAAPGEYTATFTWDTGAYQGVIEESTTFEVVAE